MFDCTRGRWSHQWSFECVYDTGQLGYTCDYCGRIKMEDAPQSAPIDPTMEYIVTDLETGAQKVVRGSDLDKPAPPVDPPAASDGYISGWSGYTDDVIQFGETYEGIVAFRIRGGAGLHFCIWSLSPHLTQLELVVNTTTGFDGTVLMGTQGPIAGFQVTSSGPWSAEPLDAMTLPIIDQPRAGAGDAVFAVASDLAFLQDPMLLSVATQTDGNTLLWAYGEQVTLLVNEVSPCGYGGTVIVPAGTQILALTCEGGWRLAPG